MTNEVLSAIDEIKKEIISTKDRISKSSDELRVKKIERRNIDKEIDILEKSLIKLNTKLEEKQELQKVKEEEYYRSMELKKKEKVEFYNKFAGYLANSYVDSGEVDCYGSNIFKTRKEKVDYMLKYLTKAENLRFLYNRHKNQVIGAYIMLTDKFFDMSEIEKGIEDLIDFRGTSNNIKSNITIKLNIDVDKINEFDSKPKKSKASTDAKSRKPFFGRSAMSTRVISDKKSSSVQGTEFYTVTVKNYSLSSLEYKGDDNKYNKLSAKMFLGLGKTKKWSSSSGKKDLNRLKIQGVSFKNGKIKDLVFGGTRRGGCLFYKNLNIKSEGDYVTAVVTMNNTQLFNSLYLAVVSSGENYKEYAQEFFREEYEKECLEFGDETFLFKRIEGYHKSEDNYFPTICIYDDDVICTGSHHGWDKPEKREYILNLIIEFVRYIAKNESTTDGGAKRIMDNILSNITLYGWFDSNKQKGEPLELFNVKGGN